jgi:hypothetical protein
MLLRPRIVIEATAVVTRAEGAANSPTAGRIR